MTRAERVARGPRFYTACIGVGLAAGLLSGLFGVGGGTVIVPLLVLFLGFDQRLAAGTSLAAIVPTASVGVVSYALTGSVAWIPALILAAGAVIGAQIGSWLLARIPQNALRWGFVGFLVVVIVMLFIVVPSREATLELSWGIGFGLAGLGLFTGIMAGLLGVGGGVLLLPVLIHGYGFSIRQAAGTGIVVLLASSCVGTFLQALRGNVHLGVVIPLLVASSLSAQLGARLSRRLPPRAMRRGFAALCLATVGVLLWHMLR